MCVCGFVSAVASSVCMKKKKLQKDDHVRVVLPDSRVTAVRMRFLADRQFVFTIEYSLGHFHDDGKNIDVRRPEPTTHPANARHQVYFSPHLHLLYSLLRLLLLL